MLLSAVALAIVLGWLPLPTGLWPGISLGLLAALAGVLELRYSFRESETEARPDLGFRIARSIN
mgnify:CR=1 FL=1